MKYILTTTDMSRYTYIAAAGVEPLRDYRKTLSLLHNRLRDSFPQFSEMLATPAVQSDGNIEWTTERFKTSPKPLDTLTGDERTRYANLFHDAMTRLKEALAALPDASEVEELQAVASVPSDHTIYCADNRIVIAEWGLRPSSGVAPISLLAFADDSNEKPVVTPVAPAAVKEEPKEPKKNVTVDPAPVVCNIPDPENPGKEDVVVEDKKEEKEEEKKELDKIIKEEEENPYVFVPPITTPSDQKAEKQSRAWLWVFVCILGLFLISMLVLLFSRCSAPKETVDNLPKTAPELKADNVVLSDDSVSYIVNNRLNLMVLSGGSLNDFIQDFRKVYPDKEKYALSCPDTVLNHVLLTLPPQDLNKAMDEIPKKLSPKYEVIAAPEGMNGSRYIPSDPAMKNHQQSYYFDMINAPEAWDVQKGDPNIIVAVLDDGFDMNHPEIQNKLVGAYDIVLNRPGTVASQSGHGQHTSGTAVGEADNNSGACGVAPGCKLMPINVFTPMGAPDSEIIKGMLYAAQNGAKVISISIGANFSDQMKFLPVDQQKQIARTHGVQQAAMYDQVYKKLNDMGVVVVIAAGNETVLAECDPMKRSKYPIVVSAVDENGDIAIFNYSNLNGSNWGDRCDISAPGLAIYNSVPGGYDYKQGTSMACPQVAGGAALVLSQHPNLDPQKVKQLLVTTAVPCDPHVGPLMDLAAALNADPDNLPDLPDDNNKQPAPDNRGGMPTPGVGDPYQIYYTFNPGTPNPGGNPYTGPTPGFNPGGNPYTGPTPNPGMPNPGGNPGTLPNPGYHPIDCNDAIRELQILQNQFIDILNRYGACL